MAHAEHARPNYVAVWAWLVGLLIVSVLAVYLPFSQTTTVTIIFLIAVAKAVIESSTPSIVAKTVSISVTRKRNMGGIMRDPGRYCNDLRVPHPSP